MARLLLLALPLLAAVGEAARARHDFLHAAGVHRRQETCNIGYFLCSDGDGCCEIGETCVTQNGVPLCKAFSCNVGVQTCTNNGVTACCHNVDEVCDATRAGFCTVGSGGSGSGPSLTVGVSAAVTTSEPPTTSTVVDITTPSPTPTFDSSSDTPTTDIAVSLTSSSQDTGSTTTPEVTSGPATTVDSGSSTALSAPTTTPVHSTGNQVGGFIWGTVIATVTGLGFVLFL